MLQTLSQKSFKRLHANLYAILPDDFQVCHCQQMYIQHTLVRRWQSVLQQWCVIDSSLCASEPLGLWALTHVAVNMLLACMRKATLAFLVCVLGVPTPKPAAATRRPTFGLVEACPALRQLFWCLHHNAFASHMCFRVVLCCRSAQRSRKPTVTSSRG